MDSGMPIVHVISEETIWKKLCVFPETITHILMQVLKAIYKNKQIV